MLSKGVLFVLMLYIYVINVNIILILECILLKEISVYVYILYKKL